MLHTQLKEIAAAIADAPAHYALSIEEYTEDGATFMWDGTDGEQDYMVKLDANGQLIRLAKPPVTGEPVSDEQKQHIAEQFLHTHYPQALHYLTLSDRTSKGESMRLCYEQFVGGIPLANYYCTIIVDASGHVHSFTYKGYTTTPPAFPETLARKETIIQQLLRANWTATMNYLPRDSYSVKQSGLYVLYESDVIYKTFDAETGLCTVEEHGVDQQTFAPFPSVTPFEPEKTVEKMIGIPDSMEVVRDMQEDALQRMVWREKDWQAAADKTIDSYVSNRFEDCVKAQFDIDMNRLKGFAWFKERRGSMSYSFEECRDIAAQFIATYYSEYVPYLQVKIEEPSFNDIQRAFFTFPITVDGYRMDDELFGVTVNQTTGLIDMLLTPDLDIATIEVYKPAPLLDVNTALQALNEVEVVLKWQRNYEENGPAEKLVYTLCSKHDERVKGIDAVSGKLITALF